MVVEDEIKPSGGDENGNMSNWSVSKMISFLLRDFAFVERVLSEREEKSKLEIKRLEANSYKLEEERLEKLGLSDEIRRSKKELEELRSETSKLRAENIVLKERDKSAEDKCKRFSDENIELRKTICKLECAKAEAEAELERKRLIFEDLKNRVLKIESGFTILTDQDDTKNNKENGHSPNAPVDSPVKANGHSLKPAPHTRSFIMPHPRFSSSQNVNVEGSGQTSARPTSFVWEHFVKVAIPNEKGKFEIHCTVCKKHGMSETKYKWKIGNGTGTATRHLRNIHRMVPNRSCETSNNTTSQTRIGNYSQPDAGITGLQSQNIVEIVDSDDDCAPVENLSEKRMTPPTGNSHSAQISVENGSRVLKRKETTSVEGENGDDDALSEKLKMRKLGEPFRNTYDSALNHCSTTSIHSDISEVNREHGAESERMPEPQVGFNLDGLPYSMELSNSSESSDSDSDFVDGVLKHLNLSQPASETRRETKI